MADKTGAATALRTAWIVFISMMTLAGMAFVQSALNPAANYRTFAAGFGFLSLLSLIRIFRLTALDPSAADETASRFGPNGVVMEGMEGVVRDAYQNPAPIDSSGGFTRRDIGVIAMTFIGAAVAAALLPAGWRAPLWLYAAIFANILLDIADWLRASLTGQRPSLGRRPWTERDTVSKIVQVYGWVAGATLVVIGLRAFFDDLA